MRRDRGFLILFGLLSALIILFLAFPLLTLFYGVGAEKLLETLQEKEVYESIWLTFRVSFYAVLFVLFTGIPLGYLIARYDFRGRSLLESLIDIPVMVPHTAAGIALLMAFNKGLLGLEFVDTTTGIMAAMMFLSAPFLINGAKEGFRKVDVKYEHVARTLGAGRLRLFFSVVLPGARNDIVNGALMMWSRGIGEFGAVVIIAYHPMVAPVLIYDRFTAYGLSYSAPVAAVMIAVSVMVFLAIRIWNNRVRM
jgi:molybdate/tungstate transport system permease protein